MKDMAKKVLRFIGKLFLYYAAIPFVGSLLCLLSFVGIFINYMIIPVFCAIVYFILYKSKRFDMRSAAEINIWSAVFVAAFYAVLMIVTHGDIFGNAQNIFSGVCFPFLPPTSAERTVLAAVPSYIVSAAVCAICARKEIRFKRTVVPVVLAVSAVAAGIIAYCNRASVRYAGHGFDYMHGFSSTDFTDYTVYAENSKLVAPYKDPPFIIENKSEMPVMDGAEACYPLYAAFAKAVYKDIDKIERDSKSYEKWNNGEIVTFTNTVMGFDRLIYKEVSLFFGARPSKDQLRDAQGQHVDLRITPIGREAFVFFVNDDNPVNGLTSEQIRAIYHGDITNWSQLGGRDESIAAFQRPANSGSQTMMEYFMGSTSLMEPKKYTVVGAMEGVVRKVAQFANDDGAMGYSFRYFMEELAQERGVKLLSVDGVAPTLENIENGSYPLTVDLCLVTREDDPDPMVEKMIEFILSDIGQDMIRRTGYAGLSKE